MMTNMMITNDRPTKVLIVFHLAVVFIIEAACSGFLTAIAAKVSLSVFSGEGNKESMKETCLPTCGDDLPWRLIFF
jgi:hypothetical protein